MVEKLRQLTGFVIATLITLSCLMIGKVVAVDIPHSPLGVIAAMVKEEVPISMGAKVLTSANETFAVATELTTPPTNTIPSVDPAVADADVSAQQSPVTKKTLHHLVLDDRSAVGGRLQVVEYAIGGAGDELVPASETTVKLISHCTTAYECRTDQDGQFRWEDVREGVYTLIADGPLGVLVMRVSVESNEVFPPSELDALLVPNVDAHYVRSMIHERLPENAALPEYMSFDAVELPDAPLPPPLTTEVNATASIPTDYEMSGRVLRLNPTSGAAVPVSETVAELVRNGRGVKPVSVEADGQCEARTLEAEYYSFVAVCEDGICAIGIEAGACGAPSIGPAVDVYPNTCCTEMAVAPYDQCGEIYEEEYVEEVPCCGDDYGGGGFGGGYGGGGGGGSGGGGGFGPLLGLAGLAGLAAFIADDDDSNQVATPF